jgi:hypothetical protein
VQSTTGFPLESIPAKAGAGMTALNSVMPAQAGIQVLLEKVANNLEKAQIAKIFDPSDCKPTER